MNTRARPGLTPAAPARTRGARGAAGTGTVRGALLAAVLACLFPLTSCTLTAADPAAAPSRGTATPELDCVALILEGQQAPGCRTTRVRTPNRNFVPQGLALGRGDTAYLSGYDWEAVPGHRECQVAHVDLRTGNVLAWAPIFYGLVPGGGRQFCRHGGGIARSRHGLWVAGAGQLWLLDPAALGSADPVLRVWSVDPVFRASTVAADADELVVGTWHERRRGAVRRYTYDDLLAPGSARLAAASGDDGVTPTTVRPVWSRLQGVALDGRGTWLARSTTYCGELVTPGRRRLPFLPGVEGVAFDAETVVAVSESGSRPYQRMGGRPDIPTLARIDRTLLDRSTAADCWPGR